jgi:hypothetical protein
MKKTLIKTGLFLLPVFLIVGSINFLVDPGNLFCEVTVEENILSYLQSGYNVENISNFNDRLLIKNYIFNLKTAPEVVVIGSSRLQQIRARHLKCKYLLNCWVPHADIFDLLGIYYLFLENNLSPKTIVLGLDPWMLNDNNPNLEWKGLKPESYKMLDSLNMAENKVSFRFEFGESKFLALVSPSYFQQSVKFLKKFNFKKPEILPTKQEENTGATRLTDLSFSYEKEFREKTTEKVSEEAKLFMTSKNNRAYYSGYTKLSIKREKILLGFINFLKRKGISVILYSPPYHPVAYDCLKRDSCYKMGILADLEYKKIADLKKVTIIGSINPKEYHLTNDMFYDQFHCKPIALDSIFNRSLKF